MLINWIQQQIKRIPDYVMKSGIVTFAAGLVIHMYVLTNKLPVSDDTWDLTGIGGGAIFQGRWLSGCLSKIRIDTMGDYSMPWLKGITAILLIAFTASFIAWILEIQSTFWASVLGIILVSFPTWAMAYAFMYLVDYFALSILLAVLAVYFTIRFHWGAIPGMFCIALSMGIYQCYFSLAIVLFLTLLLKKVYEDSEDEKKIFAQAWKYLGVLAGGVILYFIITYAFLWIVGASKVNMHGTDMGSIGLGEILPAIGNCYNAMYRLVSSDYLGASNTIYKQLFILILIIMSIVLIVRNVWAHLKNKKYLAAFIEIAATLLLPIGINIIYLMLPSVPEDINILMTYGVVGYFVVAIVLLDEIEIKFSHRKICAAIEGFGIICVLGTACGYAQESNQIYLYAELAHSSAMSYYTTLITQIKQMDGYSEDMPVCFIGIPKETSIYSIGSEFPYLNNVDVVRSGNRELLSGDYLERYLNLYCGFEFVKCTTEEKQALKEKLADTKLAHYPNAGSIFMNNGTIIVNF